VLIASVNPHKNDINVLGYGGHRGTSYYDDGYSVSCTACGFCGYVYMFFSCSIDMIVAFVCM